MSYREAFDLWISSDYFDQKTKDELLALLEMKRGVYVSGEEIASSLAVSRAAVWKAVEALRREGYPIEAVRHKGYCLSEESDLISKAGILKYLSEDSKTKSLVSLDVEQEVTSTNDILKEKAAAGAPDGASTRRMIRVCI